MLLLRSPVSSMESRASWQKQFRSYYDRARSDWPLGTSWRVMTATQYAPSGERRFITPAQPHRRLFVIARNSTVHLQGAGCKSAPSSGPCKVRRVKRSPALLTGVCISAPAFQFSSVAEFGSSRSRSARRPRDVRPELLDVSVAAHPAQIHPIQTGQTPGTLCMCKKSRCSRHLSDALEEFRRVKTCFNRML